MTPEKKVKLKICKILKEMGAYYFYASTTALQLKHLNDIASSGGQPLVVDETNVDQLEYLISKFK